MKILERSVYVAVGAADLAAEKVRTIPTVDRLRRRTLFDRVRHIEPKLRNRVGELQTRGERVAEHVRVRVGSVRSTVGDRVDVRIKQISDGATKARRLAVRLPTRRTASEDGPAMKAS